MSRWSEPQGCRWHGVRRDVPSWCPRCGSPTHQWWVGLLVSAAIRWIMGELASLFRDP